VEVRSTVTATDDAVGTFEGSGTKVGDCCPSGRLQITNYSPFDVFDLRLELPEEADGLLVRDRSSAGSVLDPSSLIVPRPRWRPGRLVLSA
jgi:hypothetical protein